MIIKESARVIIFLMLTTDGHKASCSLSATAELLVFIPPAFDARTGGPRWITAIPVGTGKLGWCEYGR